MTFLNYSLIQLYTYIYICIIPIVLKGLRLTQCYNVNKSYEITCVSQGTTKLAKSNQSSDHPFTD